MVSKRTSTSLKVYALALLAAGYPLVLTLGATACAQARQPQQPRIVEAHAATPTATATPMPLVGIDPDARSVCLGLTDGDAVLAVAAVDDGSHAAEALGMRGWHVIAGEICGDGATRTPTTFTYLTSRDACIAAGYCADRQPRAR